MNARVRSLIAALSGLGGAAFFVAAIPGAAKPAAYLPPESLVLAAVADSAGFRPAAYAGTLRLLPVLALADAQTLVLFAAPRRALSVTVSARG